MAFYTLLQLMLTSDPGSVHATFPHYPDGAYIYATWSLGQATTIIYHDPSGSEGPWRPGLPAILSNEWEVL